MFPSQDVYHICNPFTIKQHIHRFWDSNADIFGRGITYAAITSPTVVPGISSPLAPAAGNYDLCSFGAIDISGK